MSLQQAKRIAEIKEEIEVAAKKLTAQRDGFRKFINDEVTSDFIHHLEKNDFTVTKTPKGADATYKDLRISLVLADPDERYIGVFHSFDIMVNGKKNDVRVVAALAGVPDRPTVRSGDPAKLLEEDLELLNVEVESAKLTGYKFDCGQRVGGNRHQQLMKDTVSEVIDVFVA